MEEVLNRVDRSRLSEAALARIDSDLQFLLNACRGVEDEATREEALNLLWRDVQHSYYVLEGVRAPDFDIRTYDQLREKLFNDVLGAIVPYRKGSRP